MRLVTLIFTLTLSVNLFAENVLTISDAWINDAPPTLKHRAGYLTIHNPSEQDINLSTASSDAFARIEFHTSILDGEQVKMRQLQDINIKAGKTIEFEPGGLHLMLMNKQVDLRLDDIVDVTLYFSNNETQTISMSIKQADIQSIHSHDHHHH